VTAVTDIKPVPCDNSTVMESNVAVRPSTLRAVSAFVEEMDLGRSELSLSSYWLINTLAISPASLVPIEWTTSWKITGTPLKVR